MVVVPSIYIYMWGSLNDGDDGDTIVVIGSYSLRAVSVWGRAIVIGDPFYRVGATTPCGFARSTYSHIAVLAFEAALDYSPKVNATALDETCSGSSVTQGDPSPRVVFMLKHGLGKRASLDSKHGSVRLSHHTVLFRTP
jgi:hypothetical protein